MKLFSLNKGSKVYFIGIGGISMSSLAVILKNQGYIVSGSDIKKSNITDKLEKSGIKINYAQDAENIKDFDLIVYTAAISHDNPEYKASINSSAKVVERCELLGEIMKNYEDVCCVTGTHGKTTVTSMVSLIMIDGNVDPTVLVGAEVNELGGNLKIGHSCVMVAEACEYVESFLKFYPTKAIILNIDKDHLDYYKDLNHIISAFTKFSNLIDDKGYIIVNGDDKNSLKAVKETKAHIVKYGISPENDYYATNISFDQSGCGCYTLMYKDESIAEIKLSVPGIHNISNSMAAAVLCLIENCSVESIVSGLKKFHGADRRFQYLGSYKDAIIIDDYAHHPTEIKATLDTASNIKGKKITAIFQPHTFTRTKALLNEFSESFDKADNVIITDIYPAREIDDGTVHSKDLVSLLEKRGINVLYIKDMNEISEYIKQKAAPGDMFITIGAGDINKVAYNLVVN